MSLMGRNNVTDTIEADSPVARLNALLPWLNGDPLPPAEVHALVAAFLVATNRAWSGAPGGDLIGLHAPRAKGSPWKPARLERLRQRVQGLLEDADRPRVLSREAMVAWPSLRFTLARARTPAKLSRLSPAERRAHGGPGAFRQAVSGELPDLVLYVLSRTLNEPGTIALGRCTAPTANDWARPCGRWHIALGHVGRPATFCSTSCRVRAGRQRDAERRKA